MGKRRTSAVLIFGFLIISALGCTTTRISDIRSGILEDDLDRLLAVCERIDRMEKGEVNQKDLEAMGIDLGAPNVQIARGLPALKRLFGGTVVPGSANLNEQSGNVGEVFSEYKICIIPYRRIKIVSDRIYFSKKETTVKGHDMTLYMLFKKDVLYYSDYRYVHLDTYNSEYAFAQAIFTLLQAPRELMGALNEFLQQNPWLYPEFYPGIYVVVPVPD